MSTLPLRTPHVWAGFARVGAVLAMVLDVFAEAEQHANAAHKRYPFVSPIARMTRFMFDYFYPSILQQRDSIRDGTGGN
jgi:predicted RNA polymerase sigma factor